MTYEYRVEDDVELNPFYVANTLKEIGEQGWEMMSCVKRATFAGVDKYTLVFKRQNAHGQVNTGFIDGCECPTNRLVEVDGGFECPMCKKFQPVKLSGT
jgi:hypothetical protein